MGIILPELETVWLEGSTILVKSIDFVKRIPEKLCNSSASPKRKEPGRPGPTLKVRKTIAQGILLFLGDFESQKLELDRRGGLDPRVGRVDSCRKGGRGPFSPGGSLMEWTPAPSQVPPSHLIPSSVWKSGKGQGRHATAKRF